MDRGPLNIERLESGHPPSLYISNMSDSYGSYQNEIYGKGAIMGIMPGVTTDPRHLEEQARDALGVRSFNYVAGGAGEKATMDSNRQAFRQWKM